MKKLSITTLPIAAAALLLAVSPAMATGNDTLIGNRGYKPGDDPIVIKPDLVPVLDAAIGCSVHIETSKGCLLPTDATDDPNSQPQGGVLFLQIPEGGI
jgi:hypothetical protein